MKYLSNQRMKYTIIFSWSVTIEKNSRVSYFAKFWSRTVYFATKVEPIVYLTFTPTVKVNMKYILRLQIVG